VVPVVVPTVDTASVAVREQLAEQRRVLVTGLLDRHTVTRLTAELMALDGLSSRDVELVVNSSGGQLSDVLPVLDVFDLMRARVNVTCIGNASGTAVALVASGTGHRRAAPHARFSLRSDQEQRIEGTTTDIVRQAEELAEIRRQYLSSLVAATGQDEMFLARELEAGGWHNSSEAMALGIIDAVVDAPSRGSGRTGS
jgi:ATP-dependent Clp protease protease subunit